MNRSKEHSMREERIRQLLSVRSMTVTELMQATGYSRDTVLGIVHNARFAPAGQRATTTGARPMAYKVAPPLSPPERPVHPIVAGIVHDQLEMGRMIRRLAQQGEGDAALALVKVWKDGDRELKQICERMER